MIYVDESSFDDMLRAHGYSSIGKRSFGISDWNTKSRKNVIGAINRAKLLHVVLTIVISWIMLLSIKLKNTGFDSK